MATTSPKSTKADLTDNRDKLVADLKILVEDAKALTADASDVTKEFAADKAEAARDQLSALVDKLKEQGEATKQKAGESTKEMEKLIKKNPWQSIGIALLAGFLIDRILRD